jgi:fibronectin type 3 domain-containing protein
MRSLKFCFLMVLICASVSWAQRKPLAFFAAVKGDSVFLFFNQSPRIGQGFHVYRRGPNAADFERLTAAPIYAVTDANQARLMLGNDYESLAAALKVQTAEQLLVKLRMDPYFGQVATLINRRVAIVLGRFFAQGGHKSGAVTRYRLSRVDRSGKVLESFEEDILIRENPPKPVNSLTCRQEKLSVLIEWDYPKWSGDFKDLAFQFLLFRSTDGKKFQGIHDKPILRLEGMPYRFEDQSVAMGLKYTYRMVAADAAGLISKAMEAVVTTRDVIPPLRPEGMTAHVAKDTNAVSLKWNRNSDQDLAGYNIYRWAADKKDSIRLNASLLQPEKPSYTDSTMAFGTVYYYAVSAVDRAGNESRHSDRAHVLLTDKTPPGPPKAVFARLNKHAVELHWTPSPDADVKGYQVRRGYDEVTAFRLHAGLLKDTVFTDTGDKNSPMNPGGRYYYSVVAVDTMTYPSQHAGVWCSIPDDEPPARPGQVLAENHLGREIRVSWNPSVSRDVASYLVRRIASRDTIVLDTCGTGRLVTTDKSAAIGRTFTYAVSAVDTAGNTGSSTFSDPVLMKDYDPPTSPAFVTAVMTEHGVRIRWEPVGDFDLAGYNVYRSTLPTGVMKKLNDTPLTDIQFNDASGTLNNWYRIRSVDTSANESEPSKAVKVQR